MEWLNDKKNLPIIAAVTGVLLVLAAFMVYRSMRGSSSPPSPPTTAQTPQPGSEYPAPPAATPAAYPAAPGAPMASTPTAGVQPAVATPAPPAEDEKGGKVELLPARSDPFLPFDYQPVSTRPKPRIDIPPLGRLFLPPVGWKKGQKPEEEDVLPPQPQRRMAGVLYNGRVYAMLDTAGDTIVVKPGDIVENGNVRVDAIEPNRIMLSWLRTKKPIPIEVRMSEGSPESPLGGSVGSGAEGVPMPSPTMPRFGGSRRTMPTRGTPMSPGGDLGM